MSYSEEQYLKNTRDSFQAGRVVGVDEERERIIKLLEEADPEYFGCPHWQEHSKIEIAHLIALIKGEK